MNADPRKPLLLLDVDGVLNPYPHTPEGYCEYAFFPEDDEPVRLNPSHAGWLRELAVSFDIAWASSWGQAANELICPVFGLGPFPWIALPPSPLEPREKVPAVAAFAAKRAAAWVDDIVTDEARAWATERRAPTLIIEVNSASGLIRENVDTLLAWEVGLVSVEARSAEPPGLTAPGGSGSATSAAPSSACGSASRRRDPRQRFAAALEWPGRCA